MAPWWMPKWAERLGRPAPVQPSVPEAANVICLARPPRQVPNKPLVKTLRKMLEDAEAGEIQALAVAFVVADGSTRTGFHTGPFPNALQSAVALLNTRYTMWHLE